MASRVHVTWDDGRQKTSKYYGDYPIHPGPPNNLMILSDYFNQDENLSRVWQRVMV